MVNFFCVRIQTPLNMFVEEKMHGLSNRDRETKLKQHFRHRKHYNHGGSLFSDTEILTCTKSHSGCTGTIPPDGGSGVGSIGCFQILLGWIVVIAHL